MGEDRGAEIVADQATVRVAFEPGGTVEVRSGSVLLAAAIAAHFPVAADCGGRGTCGKCLVRVRGEVSAPSADEQRLLGVAALTSSVRLACRVRVLGDATVSALGPGESFEPVAIVASAVRAPYDAEPPESCATAGDEPALGLALDVGTTTLVTEIVDLCSGDILATAAGLNPQARFGADVMSRIASAGDHLAEMHDELLGVLNDLAERAASDLGAEPTELTAMTVAGNTTMLHLFLGLDPEAMGHAPYEAETLGEATVSAGDVGLTGAEGARLYVLPPVSAYVGGDVTGGLVATGLADQEGTAAFIDLGTNGEIVLKTPTGLTAASAAAGPAFEGASIECGMRAERGAIERVWMERGNLVLETVGGDPPRGICGSGLLDLVAALLDAGAIDSEGALRGDVAGALRGRFVDRTDQRVFVLDERAGVVLAQKDIRELQLAKAAVRTALDVLLAHTGTDVDSVGKVLLAGGFGRAVRPASLVRIGMLPPAWATRVTFVGNTALEGARATLVSSAAREDAARIATTVDGVALSTDPEFRRRFMSALSFPCP